MEVTIARLDTNAILPTRATDGSSGFDLYSLETIRIEPGQTVMISTGISIALPEHPERGMVYEIQVRPRSGLSKHGLRVSNAPGTIDSDYRGEIKVLMTNDSQDPYTIIEHERIAQLVFGEVFIPILVEAEELDTTERGSGGFGSTGK